MNRILERQIKKYLGGKDKLPSIPGCSEFLKALSDTYNHLEEDRKLIERSLEISSRELVELNRNLKKESEELQVIFDSMPALVFYKDRDNRYIRVNKTLVELIGMTKEQLEGKSMSDIYPKEQAEAFWKDDLEVMESGKPKLNIIEPVESKNGRLWVQTDKIPYRDARGKIIGIIGFAIDITERKKAEEASKRHMEELNKFNKLMVGRELRMVELKEENEELKKKLEEIDRK